MKWKDGKKGRRVMKRFICLLLGSVCVLAWASWLGLVHAQSGLLGTTFEVAVNAGKAFGHPEWGALVWALSISFLLVGLSAPRIESFWNIPRMALIFVVIGVLSYEAAVSFMVGNLKAAVAGFVGHWGLFWGSGSVATLAIMAGLVPGGHFFYFIERR